MVKYSLLKYKLGHVIVAISYVYETSYFLGSTQDISIPKYLHLFNLRNYFSNLV